MSKEELMITDVKIFSPTGIIEKGYLHIADQKIEFIGEGEPSNLKIQELNCNGKLLLPGFIDIHVNGGGGSLSVDGTTEAIDKIAETHSKFGTTALLPTTISVDEETLKKTVSSIGHTAKKGNMGSKVLGVHLEGPFLNPSKGGAHNKKYLKDPSITYFDELYELSGGTIKILSLAPELDGSKDLISHCRKLGVIPSLAHSDANYQQTLDAIRNGLKLCSHIFNAMPPLHHRKPGPIGAFLNTENTFVELISDGQHLHPSVMNLLIRAKGENGIIIVTDAVTPAGTKMKKFEILGVELEVKGNTCYLPNGGLAGSALTMNKAVKVIATQTSISLDKALKMASLNPARLLGVDDQKGSIEVGKDADLVITDGDLNVYTTLVEGRIVYHNNT